MARYTCSYNVRLSEKDLIVSLKEIFTECDLDLIYERGGYIMAKEKPGNVAFPKLVEIEVLYDRTKQLEGKIKVDLVAKNEELPLQTNNHCHMICTNIQSVIQAKQPWEADATNDFKN